MARLPGGHRRTGYRWAGLALVGALALTACSGAPKGPAPTSAPVETPTPTPTPTPVGPWPLTGLPVEGGVDGTAEERPALAVKVENAEAARPQTGLEQADMVWEEVVEGGITRFVAVYHSQVPEDLGPIRSVRPMDPAIAAPLHGLLAFSGGQSPFVKAVKAAGLQAIDMDGGDEGFYRATDRRAPHNVHGTPADFWAQADADHQAPPPVQFAHAEKAGEGSATRAGTPAQLLDVRMTFASRALWEWSAPDGAFLRSEGTTPAVSAAGTRLSATNVVLLNVTMVNTKYKDPAGAPVPETELVGTGEGVLASSGKSLPVTWSKTAVDEPLVLTAADGTTAILEPGTTWIELVPTSIGSFTIS